MVDSVFENFQRGSGLLRSTVSYINVSRKVGGRRVSGWRPAKLNLKIRVYPHTPVLPTELQGGRKSSPRYIYNVR